MERARVKASEASSVEGEEQGPEEAPSWRRDGPLYTAAIWALGAAFWAQLFWIAMLAEARFEVPRPWAFLGYLLPLGVLTAGALSRSPPLLLTLFAGSMLPGLVMLAEPERMLLMEGSSLLRIGAVFALYLAVASAGSGEDHAEPPRGEALKGTSFAPARAEEEQRLRRFVLARLAALGVLWAVPAYGVYLDPSLATLLSTHYGEAARIGQVFLGVVHFFIWSVAAYMMVLVPSLNVEYDKRRLARALGALVTTQSIKRSAIKALAYIALGAVGVAALLALT